MDRERVSLATLELDRARQAWRHGEPVHLTDMEYRVLDYMLDRRGSGDAREFERVALAEPDAHGRCLDEQAAAPHGVRAAKVRTARGEGYRLLVQGAQPR